jgi:simple sugar transport system permease protein
MIELAIIATVPLLLAVEGELVVQRAGMINLGIEGMMLTAAMTTVLFGFFGGLAGALLIAVLFGVFAIRLRADQIVAGTAINLFALGVTGFAYREWNDRLAGVVPHVYSSAIAAAAWIVIPIALGLMLWRTRFGLRLRACGENPEAVHASGYSVTRLRWSALIIEALLVGTAGAELARTGFAENMSAGRGFIALSIVIFGRWKVKGVLLGSALFGIAAVLQYALQAASRGVQFHLLLAVPYVVTLLILCGIAGRVRAPEALGK